MTYEDVLKWAKDIVKDIEKEKEVEWDVAVQACFILLLEKEQEEFIGDAKQEFDSPLEMVKDLRKEGVII